MKIMNVAFVLDLTPNQFHAKIAKKVAHAFALHVWVNLTQSVQHAIWKHWIKQCLTGKNKDKCLYSALRKNTFLG